VIDPRFPGSQGKRRGKKGFAAVRWREKGEKGGRGGAGFFGCTFVTSKNWEKKKGRSAGPRDHHVHLRKKERKGKTAHGFLLSRKADWAGWGGKEKGGGPRSFSKARFR